MSVYIRRRLNGQTRIGMFHNLRPIADAADRQTLRSWYCILHCLFFTIDIYGKANR